MQETLSSNSDCRDKIEETVRLSEKHAESVSAAAWVWQNCLFSDSATSSIFFSLAVCEKACIFMARLFWEPVTGPGI